MLLSTLTATASMAVSTGVGIIFIAAAIDKMRHRDIFPGVVANYRLVDERLVGAVATLLPVVEFAIGIALIAGLSSYGVIPAILLLTLFAAAMGVNIRRGRTHIDCGCGLSHLRQSLSWPLVGRNLVLALLLAPGIGATVPLPLSAKAVAVVAGLAIVLLYILFNALVALDASASRAFGKQIS